MTNSKSTKRALLTSALAIMMCLAMLIGTTFAWFTDTASTSVNTIQAGKLDVALEMWNGEKWVNAEGETLNFKAADNKTDILWEPGCTYELPKLRIANKGNLALKFRVLINGIAGDAKLNEVIDWKITYPNLPFGEGTEENVATTFLMNPMGTDGVCTLAAGKNLEFIIKGHMQETAGNEYQGLKIENVSITVLATQTPAEYDSYERTYDDAAEFPAIEFITAADLADILIPDDYTDTVNVTLDKDYIVMGEWTPLAYPTGSAYISRLASVTINGNGHSISGLTAPLLADGASVAQRITITDLTIKNSNIKGALSGNQAHAGAFISAVDNTVVALTLDKCHTVDVNVETVANVAGSGAGALIGYCYTHGSELGSVNVKISNCTVTGGRVKNTFGNAAGIVGMFATGYTEDTHLIENCTVTGCDLTGEEAAKVGQIIGTVNNNGRLDINNCTYTGNAYGRVVGTDTAVYINGTKAN